MASRAQTKQRRERVERKQRMRRKGVKSITVGPNDAAIVLRGNGQVNLTMSRAQPVPGTSAFWGYVLRWLFQPSDEGAERRKVIADEFLMDLNELLRARRLEEFREAARAELAERDDIPEDEDTTAVIEARAQAMEEDFQATQALDAAKQAKRGPVPFTTVDESDLDWDEPDSGHETDSDAEDAAGDDYECPDDGRPMDGAGIADAEG